MPGKMAVSAARQPLELPKVTAAARAPTGLPGRPENCQYSRPFGSHWGNPSSRCLDLRPSPLSGIATDYGTPWRIGHSWFASVMP
jgi:hypothetical protein